jgi:hypothetical protein
MITHCFSSIATGLPRRQASLAEFRSKAFSLSSSTIILLVVLVSACITLALVLAV